MNNIHSTSIIDPKTKIHPTVIIGPFCIIEENVEIGEGSVLESHIKIGKNSIIGKNNQIYHGTVLGGIPQDLSFDKTKKTGVWIGNDNVIKENCVIHRATTENEFTVITDKNYLMCTVHIAHDIKIGNENIIVSNTIVAGHVEIQNKAFISGLVGIHQFCKIGSYCIIGGCTKIVKDVPPYSTIDGNPAKFSGINAIGLKRAGFNADMRKKIKETYKILYHSNLNTTQAIQKIKEDKHLNKLTEVQTILTFFEKSKRGVI